MLLSHNTETSVIWQYEESSPEQISSELSASHALWVFSIFEKQQYSRRYYLEMLLTFFTSGLKLFNFWINKFFQQDATNARQFNNRRFHLVCLIWTNYTSFRAANNRGCVRVLLISTVHAVCSWKQLLWIKWSKRSKPKFVKLLSRK
jgi:hypothetical protein